MSTLPHIVEKPEKAKFYLHWAFSNITKITVKTSQLYKNKTI